MNVKEEQKTSKLRAKQHYFIVPFTMINDRLYQCETFYTIWFVCVCAYALALTKAQLPCMNGL